MRRAVLAGLLAMSGAMSPATVPAPCAARPESRQFDFWLGEWDVYDPRGTLVGTSHVESILDGCVIQENWTGRPSGEGKSWNYYDPADRQWHQFWMDASGASPARLAGSFTGGAMRLEGSARQPAPGGVPATTRLTFFPRAPDRVRQLWERSVDGGASWTVVFDGDYRRRARPGSAPAARKSLMRGAPRALQPR